MIEHFFDHAVVTRLLLLLLDGHSSHFKPETIGFTQNMELLYFASHCIQPMSVSHWTVAFWPSGMMLSTPFVKSTPLRLFPS